MSVNDPISDMITRIRNGVMSNQTLIAMPSSKIKGEIARILKEEGFIEAFEIVDGEKPSHKALRIRLKYTGIRRERRSVISGIKRVSHPGRRVYKQKNDIPWILSGLGISILTTPKGVMTGQNARQSGVGGEVLCEVW